MSMSLRLSLWVVVCGVAATLGCADHHCVCPDGCGDILFADDFEDGDLSGWVDHYVCSPIGSHEFAIQSSEADSGHILRHQGGYSAGGGNGEIVVAELEQCEGLIIEADVRNVAAYHETAKAMGLAVRLDESSGTQYLAWYSVSGDLFLYKTSGWSSCGPEALVHLRTPAIQVGRSFRMGLSVVGDWLTIYVDGEALVSCRDTGPVLVGASVGVVATAGVTHFDNVLVRKINS